MKKKRPNIQLYSGSVTNQPTVKKDKNVQVFSGQKPVPTYKSGGCGCGKKLKKK
ncbi:hypothetical protein [Ferdinandcohnia sp. SAFN-114]|uniref:hypothetical protein n=1 Tax=Ferdinandcohnia sp. SAFN-114 TaxID=3387275 RepID=UPI003F7F6B88